jgi:hypothetical protein
MIAQSWNKWKLLALLIFVPATSVAQGTPSPARVHRVPVAVAIAPAAQPSNSGYAILRRVNEQPKDVILLNPEAVDAAHLSAAVRELVLIRRATGDHPSKGHRARVRSGPNPPRGAAAPLPWAQRVVDDLAKASPRSLPGVGPVRTVTIWLPPQHPGISAP